jgi:hypothetical protein
MCREQYTTEKEGHKSVEEVVDLRQDELAQRWKVLWTARADDCCTVALPRPRRSSSN